MKHIYYSIFALLFCAPLFAQNASIQGTIQDTEGESIPFATVMVMQADQMIKAGVTELDGTYIIPSIPVGEYIVQVSFVGYTTYNSAALKLNAGEEKKMPNIALLPASEQLEEVVVTAKRPMIEVKPDKTVFNVAGSVNAQGGHALDLLKKAPGVVLDNNESIFLLGKSGVVVYIDGKPSPLSADDLSNYLKGIPATSIDNIEIITNPSSKYEAEGNAGIINIRTKKNKNLGSNATISSGIAISDHINYDAGVQFNQRNKKTNIFGSYNYSNNEDLQFIDINRRIANQLSIQNATIDDDNSSHNVKAGVDYYLNKKSTFGILANVNSTESDNNNVSTSNISFNNDPTDIDAILDASNAIIGSRKNFNINANFNHQGDENKSWNVDVDYGHFNNQADSKQPNTYRDGKTGEVDRIVRFATEADTDIDIYSFKVDRSQNLGKGQLGYGVKFALVQTDNNYIFYNVDENNTQTIDPKKTNRFLYDENVNAAYANYNYGGQKWSYQLGLRVEQTNSKGELSTMTSTGGNTNDNSYLDFFPSGGLTYNMNQKNAFRLTYSRRLNRPNYQDLNPFEFKLDELSFMKGNPFLNPEYTHNIQLGHTFNYTLNTTFSYSKTKDLITRLTDTEDNRTSFLTFENLSNQDAYSLSVSYPFSPTNWWNVFFNISGNHIKNSSNDGDSRFTEDKNINLEVNFMNLFAQSTFTLPKGFLFEVSGFYNSPGVWGGNFKTKEFWNIDAGLQKKFLDKKLSVRLGVSDIFKSQEWFGENTFGDLSIIAMGGNDSRRLKLNVSYKFGNNKVKSRKRETGLEEEKRRVSSGN